MDKRLVWADIVRILAVYLIIVLHVISVPNSSQTNFIYSMGLTLADTCVPLLVMVSGSLLLGKQESYSTFFRKRVSRVVIPWITWTILFTALVVFFQGSVNFVSVIHTFQLIFIPFFWFIILICCLYAITPALRIFVQSAKTRDILIVVLLWYTALSLLPYLRNTQAFPLYISNNIVQLTVNFIGYFLLGYLLTAGKSRKYYLPLSGIFFVISFFIRSLLAYYSFHSKINLLGGSDFIDPGLVIVSVSLFYLIYQGEAFFQQHVNSLIKRMLSLLSKATLGIYFIHYLFLNRPPLPIFIATTDVIHVSDNSDMFFNAALFYIISFAIIFILLKIPLVKNIIT